MKNNSLIELFFGAALVVLAVFLIDPFGLWMPGMLHMSILAALVAASALFGAFVLRESAADEREEAHRSLSGRFAFLAGAAVILAGLVYQGFQHVVDPWLVAALATMVAVKIGVRIYGDSQL